MKGGECELIVLRTEQHQINKSHPAWFIIDDYCLRSKNLYNYANYIIRQEFIHNHNWIRYKDIFNLVKDKYDYKNLGSNLGQQTLRLLDKTWVSFFNAIKDWSKHQDKYLGKPKLPKYKNKNGRYFLGIDNIKFFNTNGYIRFSYKPFHCMNNIFRTNIPKTAKLMQCRFIPHANYYTMEIVYQIDVPETTTESDHIAAIDLGVDNFATITNNIGLQPITIKGGVIKSMNQYYNKKKANISSDLMKENSKHWSKRLQKLTDKRYNKIKDYMHKVSKYIIDYCVLYSIDTLVCGYNECWKQESVMNHKSNQTFEYIPYFMFVNQLAYKCQNSGICFITTDESYTSGTSFLDYEEPIKTNYNKSRRIHRGMFKSNTGILINADVNGSYQIMKKVFPNAFADGIEGAGLHPLSMRIA